ncbi:MAG: ATP-binding protein [Caulobacter sp.]|nr:ATP-binding protein [Caulobacter sp.]
MNSIASQSRGELGRILSLGLLVLGIVLAAGLGAMVFAAQAVDRAVAIEQRDLLSRTLVRRQAKLVEDIVSATVWNDAYAHTVRAFDPVWADENYGVYYATYMKHDRTLIFAPNGQTIYASDAGEVSSPAALAGFAAKVAPLLDSLRRDEARKLAPGLPPPHAIAGATTSVAMIRSGEELWLVALSTVVPETLRVPQTAGPSAVVVSGRRLDAAFLTDLEKDLGIRGMHLLDGSAPSGGWTVPLMDADGRTLGSLGWTPDRVGGGILGDAAVPIILVLAAFLVAVVALSRRVLAALRALATNDEKLEAALVDLTEARDRAEAASVAKSQFLANISHEIRTPLNGVLTMAQIMDRGELAPAQRGHLEIIRDSGATLLKLLNDVLDLAKIEAGKLEIQREDTDLAALTSGVCATFLATAQEKSLLLDHAVDPSASCLWRLDAMRVNQVLANLISNAIKFTARGKVTVGVSASDRGLEFVVRDTGPGIPAGRLQDLFGKFNQLDASTTREFGGTGLGLAICHELVVLMGGEMSVESTVGVGSAFSFHLPAESLRGRMAA